MSHIERHLERTLQQRVADNVRAEMARNEISAQQLADALGMSVQSVSAKRRGEVVFTLKDLEAIAPLFGMTPGELVDGNIVYVDFVHRGPRADLREDKTAAVPAETIESETENSPAAKATGESMERPPRCRSQREGLVAPTGVDPVTFRFSVERSTN